MSNEISTVLAKELAARSTDKGELVFSADDARYALTGFEVEGILIVGWDEWQRSGDGARNLTTPLHNAEQFALLPRVDRYAHIRSAIADAEAAATRTGTQLLIELRIGDPRFQKRPDRAVQFVAVTTASVVGSLFAIVLLSAVENVPESIQVVIIAVCAGVAGFLGAKYGLDAARGIWATLTGR